MTVLHTVASLHPDTGGPARTVGDLCTALAEAGVTVDVVSRRSEEAPALAPEHPEVTTAFSPGGTGVRGMWAFRQALARQLETNHPDVVHDHGVWLPTNLISAVVAARQGIPLVVTTRGMLEPWAVSHQAWKKRLAWYGYQRWILQHASLLHATAPMEADHLRDVGLTAPIAVIPNGVQVPDAWKQESTTGDTRQALFLSRIHRKKGLIPLIDAWAGVRPDKWRLVIAGPSEDDHQREVEARVEAQGLEESVTFPGPISEEDKWALYRQSDLFVLPSYSENFGVVVAEALASGVPVLTTTGTPWSVLEDEECGWWVEPEREALLEALSDAVSRSAEERLAMGRRGRALVKERYTWNAVARQMKEAYDWLLGTGACPDFIYNPDDWPR